MLRGIEINCHSSIKMNKGLVIYIDPFKIDKDYNDADLILITHSHYDHFSEEDILKVKSTNTKIVITKDLKDKVFELGFNENNVKVVKPNEKLTIGNVNIETIPAYNLNKKFHPKENEWVGYLITISGITYYIAGDTDITEENKNVKCDVALVPVGGTYTMTSQESAELVNTIKPKIAIPTHYGDIVGTMKDGENFKQMLEPEVNCEILIK